MRRWYRLALTVAMVTAFVGAMAAPAGAAPSPFTGAWTAVDIDGSDMRMAIGGGPSPRVLLIDYGASVCGLDDSGVPLYAARVTGRATIEGDVLSADLDVYCHARPTFFLGTFPGAEYTYDAGTDTLLDGIGVVWSRASG